ncbi:Glycine cleavage system transcriptional repressor [Propionicimonas sp. T2.31MG-18]|uniref:glycine cleavage system protein R n=1 Tax=Propionicimonas sp. T2.31MG-18 TaxID=3157620 RepID=UPI0035F05369
MSNLVLTVVGDDRAGLVAALADVVSAHGGNWEHSQLAELAGTFAGIVVVSVPDDRLADLTAALGQLDGLLKVTAHPGSDAPAVPAQKDLTLTVLGNDHPGIVRDISAVLSRHGASIESLTSESREAPMSGGRLFEATVVARLPQGAEPATIAADLERLAAEILVDISLTGE